LPRLGRDGGKRVQEEEEEEKEVLFRAMRKEEGR
jgi:hypothetical protein